ncbi:MAG: Fur family transcriptional regulator, partial [Ilumatobacteraceae bacterium]
MSIDEVLRARDFRVTRARQLVWEVLTRSDSHRSATEILEEVHQLDDSINASSVYRALALFSDLDLVRESHLGELSTWEPAHEDEVIHLICEKCHTTIHFNTSVVDRLRTEVARDTAFSP